MFPTAYPSYRIINSISSFRKSATNLDIKSSCRLINASDESATILLRGIEIFTRFHYNIYIITIYIIINKYICIISLVSVLKNFWLFSLSWFVFYFNDKFLLINFSLFDIYFENLIFLIKVEKKELLELNYINWYFNWILYILIKK